MIPHGRRLLPLAFQLALAFAGTPLEQARNTNKAPFASKLAARFCEDNLLQAVVRISRCLLPSLPFGWQVCGLVAGGCADRIAGRCANQDCWRVCGLHLLPGVWIMLAGGRITSFKPWDRSIMVPKSMVQSTWNVAPRERLPDSHYGCLRVSGLVAGRCADWMLAGVRIKLAGGRITFKSWSQSILEL